MPNHVIGSRHEQSGPGAPDADVEQLLAIGLRAFHADHRAHRAGEHEGYRDKKRQAGRHVVAKRLDEVPHFVGQQDADHRPGVDQSVQPVGRDHLVDGAVCQVRGRVPVQCPGDECRGAGGEEQEHGQDDAAPVGDRAGGRFRSNWRRGHGTGRLAGGPPQNIRLGLRRQVRHVGFASKIGHDSSIAAGRQGPKGASLSLPRGVTLRPAAGRSPAGSRPDAIAGRPGFATAARRA